jgi:hypothetical protein
MRLPGPQDLLRLVGAGIGAAERAIALVPRLVVIVDQVEDLLVQVRVVVSEIEEIAGRSAGVVVRTERVVSRVERVVGRAEGLTSRVQPLLDAYQPILEQLQPMIARLADTTSPDEVDAVVRLINTLPEMTVKMQKDILPILDTLGTVAPDLRDLLDVSKEFNEMLGSVPGLGRVKKRIEERQDQEDEARADEYRANETPPAAPDRQG